MMLSGYSQYKDSFIPWLGKIPVYWDIKRIKFVFPKLFSGVSVNSENIETEQDSFGVLKTSCVYGNKFTPSENKRVIYEELDRVACPVVADSLIISRMNTPELVGNCGFVENNYPNLFLPDRLWIAHFAKHNLMYGKFAWYLCISDCLIKLTGALATGTSGSMKNLSQDAFLNILATAPPIAEQIAIAHFLDRETGRIDTLVEKKKRLITLLKEKRTALISRTVTRGLPEDATREFGLQPHGRFKDSGIEWLEQVPEGWDVWKLAHACTHVLDGTHFSPESTAEGDRRYITAKNIKEWGIDLSNVTYVSEYDHREIYNRCPVQRDDVLYIKDGATAGIATINTLEEEFSLLSSVALIRPRLSVILPKYLAYQMNTMDFKQFVLNSLVGGAMTRFTLEIISKFKLIAPPLYEQSAIVTHLDIETSKIDRLLEKIEAVIERLQELRTALITAAVTGKIDVRSALPQKDVA